MRKFFAMLIMMAMLAIMVPIAADAQTTYIKRYKKNGRWYTTRVYKKPSYYRRHRNAINIAAATGAGALIGGIAKGGKGAGIGALIGAGSGALYTYKIKPKKRKYYKVRRY
jgi:hypothetical protein